VETVSGEIGGLRRLEMVTIERMITRRWRGWTTTPANADAYATHFDDSVRPRLDALDGFLGASLERVPGDDGRTEIVVVTRWESMDAIRGFAGADIDAAQVEPEARAVLDDFDERVTYAEVRDDTAFDHLALIDVAAEAAAHEPWFNETLTFVNDSVVRLGVLEGEFHWHKHDEEDEFFLVLDGTLLVDLQDAERTIALGRHQGLTVPSGVVHRTRAPARTTVLMIERAGVVATGN
jgi:mannose-6-phosphate isomerase-like protein (cupin superfamily)